MMFVLTNGIAILLIILPVLAAAAATGALAARFERKLVRSPADETATIPQETVREHARAA